LHESVQPVTGHPEHTRWSPEVALRNPLGLGIAQLMPRQRRKPPDRTVLS